MTNECVEITKDIIREQKNTAPNNKYEVQQASRKSCPDCSELCGEFTYCENANN